MHVLYLQQLFDAIDILLGPFCDVAKRQGMSVVKNVSLHGMDQVFQPSTLFHFAVSQTSARASGES
jgi:hypothetical protein